MQRSEVNEEIIAQTSTPGRFVREQFQRSRVTVAVHLSHYASAD